MLELKLLPLFHTATSQALLPAQVLEKTQQEPAQEQQELLQARSEQQEQAVQGLLAVQQAGIQSKTALIAMQ
jgi:hypothetical protein